MSVGVSLSACVGVVGENQEEESEEGEPAPSPPPKVYPPRECAFSTCKVIHRRKSKYCSQECGLSQAKLQFEQQNSCLARGSPQTESTITRSDAEDLKEFEAVKVKIKDVDAHIISLRETQVQFEAVLKDNAKILVDTVGVSSYGKWLSQLFDVQYCCVGV